MLVPRNHRNIPEYHADIYSRQAIAEPYPHYARLRQLGPVVWLSRRRVFALPRYVECKTVLRDDTTFISGKGMALNPIASRLSRGTTLNSDGAEHDQRRKLVAHRLLPRALHSISDGIDKQAASVATSHLRGGKSTGSRTSLTRLLAGR